MGSTSSKPIGERGGGPPRKRRVGALLLTVVLWTVLFAPVLPSSAPNLAGRGLGPAGEPRVGIPADPNLRTVPSTAPRAASHAAVSQIDETGTQVAVVPGGSYPEYLGVDPVTGYVYVPDGGYDTVTVLNGSTDVANVTVTGGVTGTPYTAAYDASDGDMYVTVENAGNVVVINGTVPVANLTVPNDPYAAAYDPSNGYMYIGEEGANQALVLNGTTVVGTVKLSGSPIDIAYDPANGWMYFADTSAVDAVNGTTLLGNVTSNGSLFESGMVYDPTTKEMFVGNDGGNNITILQNLTINGSFKVATPGSMAYDSATSAVCISSETFNGTQYVPDVVVAVGTTLTADFHVNDDDVAPGIQGMAYDPLSAEVYVASGPQNVSVVSTVLGLDPLYVSPTGQPNDSVDVGQERNFSAVLWAVGNGTLTPSLGIAPSGDWACDPLAWNSSPAGPDTLRDTCTAEAAGDYDVWANVTDGLDERVSVEATITVFPGVTVVVQPRIDGQPVRAADAGATVDFWVNVTGGSGNLSYGIGWSPSDFGECSSLLSDNDFQCVFPLPALLEVQGYATDSNGETNVSSFLSFSVVSDLVVGTPTASPGSADVGQSVRLNVSTTNGTGVDDSFVWTGLPAASCTGTSTSAPVCEFPIVGTYPIQVVVRDTGGGEAASATLDLDVDPVLQLSAVEATRASLDVGQSTSFNASATGGLAPYSFTWFGLPAGCPSAPTGPEVNCTGSVPGPTSVRATVTDENGQTVNASAPVAVAVFAALLVGVPTANPATVDTGSSLTIGASASGGAPELTYVWSGLPPGCAGTGPSIPCRPTSSGTYSVQVTVSDANGASAKSPALALVVGSPGAAPSGGGLSTSTWDALIVGAVIAVAAMALVAVLYRRRRGDPPP
jgi:hypothetical protein